MTKTDGRLRADARRNRDRLLAAAEELLAERGTGVTMDEIARKAGVGAGTLYRHFPDRTELLAAAARKRIAHVSEAIDAALQVEDAGVALRSLMHEFTREVARDRALTQLMIAENTIELPELTEFRASSVRRLARLTKRAQAAGAIRKDISATDLIALTVAIARLPIPGMDSKNLDIWERYLPVVLDGLRPSRDNTPLPHQAPPAPKV